MILPPERLPRFRRYAALGLWLNQLRDYCASLQPLQSLGLDTSHTATGVFRRPRHAARIERSLATADEEAGPTGTTGPLFQGLYSRVKAKIYAVRGQYLYVFDAAGTLEKELRWHNDAMASDGSLVEIPAHDDQPWKLFLGMWRNAHDDLNHPPFEFLTRDIYDVDPDAETSVALGLANQLDSSINRQLTAGFKNLVTDGTLIHGQLFENGRRFYVDPADISTFTQTSSESFTDAVGDNPISDALWDPINDGLVAAAFLAHKVRTTAAIGDWDLDAAPCGICLCPSVSAHYAVAADGQLYQLPWADTSVTAVLDGLKAARVKCRRKLDRLYIPDWSNDRILIVKPSDNSIEKTLDGFNSPFDVIFTDADDDPANADTPPGQAFALQLSSQGLKPLESTYAFDSTWKLS